MHRDQIQKIESETMTKFLINSNYYVNNALKLNYLSH